MDIVNAMEGMTHNPVTHDMNHGTDMNHGHGTDMNHGHGTDMNHGDHGDDHMMGMVS